MRWSSRGEEKEVERIIINKQTEHELIIVEGKLVALGVTFVYIWNFYNKKFIFLKYQKLWSKIISKFPSWINSISKDRTGHKVNNIFIFGFVNGLELSLIA